MSFTVRIGIKADLPKVMELIMELAKYENGEDQVSNSLEMMEKDGFGENPIYRFFVAESNGHIVGTSIFYFRYSTWKGRRLYLEDIVVTENMRGKGVGKLLFDRTIEEAKLLDCTGMMWQVLDWNDPAINFYKKYNATLDDEWINCHLDF